MIWRPKRNTCISGDTGETAITAETYIPSLFGGAGGFLWGTASPLFDSAGNRIGAIEVIRDITEKKHSEDLLRQREAMLETLLNAPRDTIALLDRKGIIIGINEEGARRLGGTVRSVTGQCAYDLLPRPLATARKAQIDHVFEIGKPALFDDERSGMYLHNDVYPVFNPEHTAVEHIAIFATDITEQKKAEQALQESEKKYRFLIDNVRDIVWQTTPDLTFTYVSPAAETLTGYPPADLIGTSLFGILTDSSARVVQERLRERMEDYSHGSQDLATVFETEIQKKDGGLLWVEVSSNAVFGPDGTIAGFSGISRDIGERKRAEKALVDSEVRFRDLFNNMSAGVVIYEPAEDGSDFIIKDINRAVETIEKVKREEVAGRSILEIFPAVVEFGLFPVLQRVARTGVAEAFPVSFYQDNRISGWRENYVYKIPSGEIVAIYEDVTEKKQAEEALKRSRIQLAEAMDLAQLVNWEFDALTGIFTFNDRFYALYGTTAEREGGYEMPAETYAREFVHPDDRYLVADEVAKAIHATDPRFISQVEHRIVRRDGEVRHIIVRFGITKDADGRTIKTHGANQDITDRIKAEEELRESEARLDLALRSAGMGVWYWDIREDRRYFDHQTCQLLGIDPATFRGSPAEFFTIVHPDDRENVKEALARTIDDDIPYEPSYRAIWPDGSIHFINARGRLVKDTAGKPARINGIIWDVTGQKRVEVALRESETRFRALIQNSSDIIRILDQDGRILYESPSSSRILGYPPGYLIGRNPLEYIHPDDLERVTGDFREVIAKTNSGTPTEFRVRKADGEYIWVDSIGLNLLDVPGVNGIVITTRPIQQRKEVEQALSESEERLRLALEGADAAFWDWHLPSGRAVFSDRFYTMLGYEPGEFPATYEGLKALMHPDERDRVLSDLQDQIRRKRPLCEIEYRLRTKEGDWIWILARGKIVDFDDRGNPVRLTGVNIDITNRRLMESEIRSLNTVLEQRVKDRTDELARTNQALQAENAQRLAAETKLMSSLEEKTMLLKEIHHRVKNNLQIIASLLNLQSRYIKDESTLAAIRESQNRVKAMALVHEKLYRSEDIAHISLHDYIRFLGTGLFQFYDAKTRGIRFRLDIHDIDVDIDAAIPLGLIINELISNSLKYAFPDGRTGEVSVSVKKTDHTLTIRFRDDGIGIPADLDWKEIPRRWGSGWSTPSSTR